MLSLVAPGVYFCAMLAKSASVFVRSLISMFIYWNLGSLQNRSTLKKFLDRVDEDRIHLTTVRINASVGAIEIASAAVRKGDPSHTVQTHPIPMHVLLCTTLKLNCLTSSGSETVISVLCCQYQHLILSRYRIRCITR